MFKVFCHAHMSVLDIACIVTCLELSSAGAAWRIRLLPLVIVPLFYLYLRGLDSILCLSIL